jgi:hypothetical protein
VDGAKANAAWLAVVAESPPFLKGNVYKRSSYCNNATQCVEVAPRPQGGVAIRDSKDLAKPPIYFDAQEWRAFVAEIKGS